jgi:hypothetical protein
MKTAYKNKICLQELKLLTAFFSLLTGLKTADSNYFSAYTYEKLLTAILKMSLNASRAISRSELNLKIPLSRHLAEGLPDHLGVFPLSSGLRNEIFTLKKCVECTYVLV